MFWFQLGLHTISTGICIIGAWWMMGAGSDIATIIMLVCIASVMTGSFLSDQKAAQHWRNMSLKDQMIARKKHRDSERRRKERWQRKKNRK